MGCDLMMVCIFVSLLQPLEIWKVTLKSIEATQGCSLMELGVLPLYMGLVFSIQPSTTYFHLALSSQPHIYVTCLAHVSTAACNP